MSIILNSRYSLLFFAFFLSFANFSPPKTLASGTPISFTFDEFHKNATLDSNIALYGDAVVEDSAVRMNGVGKLLYKKPFKFQRGNSGFSTYFCFSISPLGNHNLAFFLDSAISKNVLFVEFASNASGRYIIEVRADREFNSESCNFSSGVALLSSAGKLYSWVDYDIFSKRIDVRLSKFSSLRPSAAFISCPLDISSVLLKEALLAGICSSSNHSTSAKRNSVHGSSIYSWSFVVNHGAPYLMHSEPLDPGAYLAASQQGSIVHRRNSYNRVNVMAWLFGLVCGALMVFVLLFAKRVISCRSPFAATECPVHPSEVVYKKAMMIDEKAFA